MKHLRKKILACILACAMLVTFAGTSKAFDGIYIVEDTTQTQTSHGLTILREPVTVFVNGQRINGISPYLSSSGQACIYYNEDLYKIFPTETLNTYFSVQPEETTLASWATRFGYTCIQNENRVYLTSSYQKPVEVMVNGKLVEFTDQQPVILPPGRTMVPVRTIAELFGCEVTWDPKNDRVVIISDGVAMALWLNSAKYWLNGSYYSTDVATTLVNDRTLVPLRLISEAFGCTVTYNDSGAVGIVNIAT